MNVFPAMPATILPFFNSVSLAGVIKPRIALASWRFRLELTTAVWSCAGWFSGPPGPNLVTRPGTRSVNENSPRVTHVIRDGHSEGTREGSIKVGHER